MIRKKDKNWFSLLLNWAAAIILFASCLGYIYKFLYQKKETEKITYYNISLNSDTCKRNEITFKKLSDLKDTLNQGLTKYEELKEHIKERDSENGDMVKLIGTIISIIGFLGYKSIHDTRENAIKKATDDAVEKAIVVAKKTAEEISKEIAKNTEKEIAEIAKKTATEVSITSSEDFLTAEIPKHFRRIEETLGEINSNSFASINDRIDKLERPRIFGGNEYTRDYDIIKEEVIKTKQLYLDLIDLYTKLIISQSNNKKDGN